MNPSREQQILQLIRRRYSHMVATGNFLPDARNRALACGYKHSQLDLLPDRILNGFSGCGSPLNFADVRNAQTIIDIGCGVGIDSCLLSMEFGHDRHVIAFDVTEELLALTSRTKKQLGLEGLRIVCGDMHQIPIGPDSVDLIIANAAINLSFDKVSLLAECFRILKPGGQICASDLIPGDKVLDELPIDPMGANTSLGQVIPEDELKGLFGNAGFRNWQVIAYRKFDPVTAIDFRVKK